MFSVKSDRRALLPGHSQGVVVVCDLQGGGDEQKAIGDLDTKGTKGEARSSNIRPVGKESHKEAGSEKQEVTPKQKAPIELAMTRSTKLRSEYSAAVVQAQDLAKTISTMPEWSFADNDQNGGVLREALQAVNTAAHPHLRILNSSLQVLRKGLGDDTLLVQLTNFKADLQGKVNELQKVKSRLVAMQRAMVAASS